MKLIRHLILAVSIAIGGQAAAEEEIVCTGKNLMPELEQ